MSQNLLYGLQQLNYLVFARMYDPFTATKIYIQKCEGRRLSLLSPIVSELIEIEEILKVL